VRVLTKAEQHDVEGHVRTARRGEPSAELALVIACRVCCVGQLAAHPVDV
jgi:hypothetical protein